MSEQQPDVIGSDGQAVALPPSGTPLGDLVEQPAKVMRIGAMIRQLLEEVKAAPLDEASRSRLRTIHLQSVEELKDGLAPELVDELERLSLPFDGDAPSEGELRIAQAQLVGWLEGLFHGIQAALYAQQVQAQSQLQTMRLALPGPNDIKSNDSESSGENGSSGGMYL
ncbi:MAG: bacterial proteasome activator family protein [Aeromicrobium sp.]